MINSIRLNRTCIHRFLLLEISQTRTFKNGWKTRLYTSILDFFQKKVEKLDLAWSTLFGFYKSTECKEIFKEEDDTLHNRRIEIKKKWIELKYTL